MRDCALRSFIAHRDEVGVGNKRGTLIFQIFVRSEVKAARVYYVTTGHRLLI